eukprot:Plantae.Rhodophyta-Rhodochaete_pulchella.ctg25461.p2 GENE.Plantae.Rhodophyta-Rhodochaete_pulchella.ctg25461~~Plantae.Rhodophyta-Rhodochaete_pulchella.ctg25461.p2  ORF type:complete len:115 (-),score=20.06 Plantae.Rhodophyta-Rhodochaete_pulchella.ctg25461:232-576(-)
MIESRVTPGKIMSSSGAVINSFPPASLIAVVEKTFTMDELAKACNEGRVLEAFGCGTAAVVSPIKNINYDGVDYNIPIDEEHGSGPLTKEMWTQLTDIQYGRREGPEGWSVVLD